MENNTLLNQQNQVQVHQEVETESKLRPNFSKAELSQAVLPKKIAKEIRWEKYWILFMNLLGMSCLIVSTFFLLAWFVPEAVTNEETQITTKWLINVNSIPLPGFMFVMLGIGLLVWILSWIEYAQLINSVNRYKADILLNVQSVPYFLIKSYRSIVSRIIYINWICGVIYVVGAISIGIMFAISAINSEMMLTAEKTIAYVIVGLAFAFHLISLVIIKYRKGNLNAFYGKDLLTLEEQKQLKKTANKRCLITFIVVASIILVFVIVPWMLIRKRKGLKPIPFI